MSFFKKLFSSAKPKDDYINDLGELTDDGKQGIMLIAISGNFRALEKLLSHSNSAVRKWVVDCIAQAGHTASLGNNEFRINRDTPLNNNAKRLLRLAIEDKDPAVVLQVGKVLDSEKRGDISDLRALFEAKRTKMG